METPADTLPHGRRVSLEQVPRSSLVDQADLDVLPVHDVVYMPFDFFLKPMADDREVVWPGPVRVLGRGDKPIHWVMYALGAWGFWGMRRWMWPWAAVYSARSPLACSCGT